MGGSSRGWAEEMDGWMDGNQAIKREADVLRQAQYTIHHTRHERMIVLTLFYTHTGAVAPAQIEIHVGEV